MLIEQLSIFVENKKGRLAEVTGILAKHNVDIRALCIADTTDYGILRLIVDKPGVAVECLKEEGLTVSLTKVIAIAIPDTPGSLYKAVDLLAKHDIAVEYMYAFLNPKKDTAFVILRVEDNEKAIKVLTDGGVALMKSEEMYTL
ncbi:MAG TPA: ACT domain-containing protein [Clostridiales bacterium]|nr:ACT domain-containing protein [Clostridiales bacterium]